MIDDGEASDSDAFLTQNRSQRTVAKMDCAKELQKQEGCFASPIVGRRSVTRTAHKEE